MKLLLIEDSERLRRSLQHGLSRSGFALDVVGDGAEGLEYATLGDYDVIVLDLMLPRLDGLSVLQQLRARGDRTHVLILSAKGQTEERIAGLHAGADDYLTKPFSFDELVARLRALVRREYGQKNPAFEIGGLRLDTARRSLTFDDRLVPLTNRELSLLGYLVARRGAVVTKEQLLQHLYAGHAEGSSNAIEVFVHQVRKKIRDAGHPDVIRTHRGHGYSVD